MESNPGNFFLQLHSCFKLRIIVYICSTKLHVSSVLQSPIYFGSCNFHLVWIQAYLINDDTH